MLRAGDLVVLTGGLGAGKTTLTQGIGEGVGVRGPVTSPTFVIARVHPSTVGGPALVHVDAYRLGGALELDDLDLDASVDDSVTVVEWGHGLAEDLSEDRLEVVLDVDTATEERTATVTGIGGRWAARRPMPRGPGWSPWAVCRADARARHLDLGDRGRRAGHRLGARGRAWTSTRGRTPRSSRRSCATRSRGPVRRRATSPTSPSAPGPGRSPACGWAWSPR